MFKIIIENQYVTKVRFKILSKILGKLSGWGLPSPPENYWDIYNRRDSAGFIKTEIL
jgi:hypothetical protein